MASQNFVGGPIRVLISYKTEFGHVMVPVI